MRLLPQGFSYLKFLVLQCFVHRFRVSVFAGFSVFLFLSFSVSPAFSQTFDFNRAYQDYLYNYNLYRESFLNFIAAKGEFKRYKTLTSESKALETTRTMLKARSDALQTYLTAMRMKTAETPGIPNYPQNLTYVKLDTEVAWIANHKSTLSSPGTIADLLKASSTLQQRYSSIELLSYQALSTILSGKENAQREKVIILADRTDEKIGQMRSEGENVDKLERWVLEARNKITLSEEKQLEAENVVKSMKEYNRDKRRTFNQTQFIYEESNQYLKEALSFLTETIKEMKYE